VCPRILDNFWEFPEPIYLVTGGSSDLSDAILPEKYSLAINGSIHYYYACDNAHLSKHRIGTAVISTALVEARPAALASFDLSRLLEAFLDGRNERTLAAYRADLEGFRAFLGAATVGEASSRLLSGSHGEANAAAIAYKAHMTARRLQAATINRRLAALRSLVKLANTLGLVSWTLAVENVKVQAYRDTRGPGLDAYRRSSSSHERSRERKVSGTLPSFAFFMTLGSAAVKRSGWTSRTSTSGDRLMVLGKARSQKEPVTLPERRRRLRSRRGFRPAARKRARSSSISTAPAKADASPAPPSISSSAGSGRRPGSPSVRTGFGILPLLPPSISRRATCAPCKNSPGTRTCGCSTPTTITAGTLQVTWRGSWPGCRSLQDTQRRGS
jgi:hypothetical protein